MRLILRTPVLLDRAGLGWLAGPRVLILTHEGRRTGQERKTALEIVTHNRATGEYVVMSAWGPGADWVRNLSANPAREVRIGRKRFVPHQRFLTSEETAEALHVFWRQHPRSARFLWELFDWGTRRADDVSAMAASHPAVGFRPATVDEGARRVAASRSFGLGRGKVFPATAAWQLHFPGRALLESPRRLAGDVPVERGGVVVELGCGSGFFSAALAAAVTDGGLTLVDLQVGMLTRARDRLRGHGVANASLTAGDGLALPLRSASVDAVVIATALGEMPDRRACLAEARRVLLPSGAVVVSEIRFDPDFVSVAELSRHAAAAGLRLDRTHGHRWRYTATLRPVPGGGSSAGGAGVRATWSSAS